MTDEEILQMGKLIARAQDVRKHMHLFPKLMFPPEFFAEATKVYGYEVLRGDRFAVVLEVE